MKEKRADSQHRQFQLTINNPKYNHHQIKKELIEGFSTLQYFCMSDEIGKEGTPHTHIYMSCRSRVRFSTVKRHFQEAHIEPARGSAKSNIDYIRKTGKWADTAKAETRIEGTFEEWGTLPSQKGTRQDMEELYNMILSGMTNSEIIATNNDYILYIDKFDRLRTMLLQDKYRGKRRTDLMVIYIYGATGTGKTRDILDTHGDEKVYRITDYQHPFDGYSCEPVIVFEEFRSLLKLSDMLNYCDIYPVELPARYANKYACYNTVYIVSNWPLEHQFQEVQRDNPESWRAFLRRIHKVNVYSTDGTIIIYNSVEEYFNRDNRFRPVLPKDNNPFM